VARFGQHAAWLAFRSSRFDHSSELPLDANAGNRFYGRDVAAFIAAGLAERGLDASFFDEDWGWQVHAEQSSASVLEISIYHNPDEEPAAEDEWWLMLRSLRRERRLAIRRFRESELGADAIAAVEGIFRCAGITLMPKPPR